MSSNISRLPQHLQRFPRTCCGHTSGPRFSTCSPLSLRVRPGQRRPRTQLNGGINWESSDLGTVETPSKTTTPKKPIENSVGTGQATQQNASVAEPTTEQTPARSPRPSKSTIRGLKSYQRSIYECESICYQNEHTQPKDASRKDRPPMAAAAKFLEHDCRLLYSAETLYQHPQNDHIPEIVVLGASNAGKSSFLNALVGRSSVARVSQRPGRTTTMNAYGVGPNPKIPRDQIKKGDRPPRHSLILMDTPGYGFKSRTEWGSSILKYLDVRSMLRGAILLIPAEKKFQEMDRWMLRTLAKSNTRTLIVLTKADKKGDDWPNACGALITAIRGEIQKIEGIAASSWREAYGHSANIFATAANMGISTKLGNGGGIGGVRLAVMEMAGFSLQERVENKPEMATYGGPVISFDTIQWKS